MLRTQVPQQHLILLGQRQSQRILPQQRVLPLVLLQTPLQITTQYSLIKSIQLNLQQLVQVQPQIMIQCLRMP